MHFTPSQSPEKLSNWIGLNIYYSASPLLNLNLRHFWNNINILKKILPIRPSKILTVALMELIKDSDCIAFRAIKEGQD